MKKFNSIFRYTITIVVFLVLLYILYENYQNTTQIIKSSYDMQSKTIENSIYNTIKYADAIDQTSEIEANRELNDYSLILTSKYRRNPNVLAWNLEELKKQFNNSDVYIINDQLKVVKTSFKEDLGFDFSKLPVFSKIIAERLKGDSFITDHMDISTNTGLLMKYGYMPTPDHKYLIELSINMSERFPIIKDLDIFSTVDSLKNQYKSVDKISVYKFKQGANGFLSITKDKPYYKAVMDNNKIMHIQQAVKLNKVQMYRVNDPALECNYTYKYIPNISYPKIGKYDWWNSYIIEVIYNDNVMIEDINKTKAIFWHSTLIIAAVFLIFILIITYLFSRSEYIANHDHLTNLPNRKMFEDFFKQRLTIAERLRYKMAVLFLDLNNFKEINDTFGHDIGDKLLQNVADRLRGILRKGDFIARLGGDEFIILLSDVASYDDVVKVALKIDTLFKVPIIITEHEIPMKVSIGISIYPDHSTKADGLIHKADIAMYHAKRESLNYMLYNNIGD